jgi:hypothetical protein
MKFFFNFMSIFVMVFFIGGCSTSKYIDGLYIPTDTVKKENSKTKVYYEDESLLTIKHNLQNIIDFLNNNAIIPKFICKSNNFEAKEDKEFYNDLKCVENTSMQQFNIKFNLNENTNYVSSDKVYDSIIEVFNEFINIREFLYEELNKNPELRDKLGMSSLIYYDLNKLFNEKKLAFTIQREIVRDSISNIVKNQIHSAGWEIVDNKDNADKVYLFDLTRDYSEVEKYQIRVKGKNIKVSLFEYSTSPISLDFNTLTSGYIYDQQGTPANSAAPITTNYSQNAALGASAMKLASKSNSSGTSATIGISTAVGVGIIEAIISSKHFNSVIPVMKEVDKNTNSTVLRCFQYGIHMGNEKEKEGIIARINNSMIENVVTFVVTPIK